MRRPCRRYSQPYAPGSGDNNIGALHDRSIDEATIAGFDYQIRQDFEDAASDQRMAGDTQRWIDAVTAADYPDEKVRRMFDNLRYDFNDYGVCDRCTEMLRDQRP